MTSLKGIGVTGRHVRADAPPFLLLNAGEDEKLEEEADELSSLLRKQGVRAKRPLFLAQPLTVLVSSAMEMIG